MKRASQIIENIKLLGKNAEFIPTGFKFFDKELDGGFMKKELIVIGGYTGSGKSYLAGQITLNAAKQGFNTAYFSLEISNEMVVARLVGSEANIKPSRIIGGLLNPDENRAKLTAQGQISAFDKMMIFADDIYNLSEIIKIIKANEFQFIVIDFIQNVIGKSGDEYENLSYISLQLQKLAKETNSCILVLSQLSNTAHRAGLLEYKGSGSIATVCDLGMFITRNEDDPSKILLEIRKNRRGRSGIAINLQSVNPGGRIKENYES